jgi:hypothetical protein
MEDADAEVDIDTTAPPSLEVTIRLTFVGQKANQGQLLPLLLPTAALRQAAPAAVSDP